MTHSRTPGYDPDSGDRAYVRVSNFIRRQMLVGAYAGGERLANQLISARGLNASLVTLTNPLNSLRLVLANAARSLQSPMSALRPNAKAVAGPAARPIAGGAT